MKTEAFVLGLWASVALGFALESSAVSLLPPTILQPPLDRTVPKGTVVTFRVDANGYPPLSYQWRRNGSILGSAATDTLTVNESNSVRYDVIVTNFFGSVTSAPALLTVQTQAPGIYRDPQSQVACSGGTTALSVSVAPVTTNSPLHCQWRQNGADVAGATATNLSFPSITPADAGDYTVVVTNNFGAVTSAVATLTVDPPAPVIMVQPASQLANAGATTTLSVQAAACSSLGYQWRSNGMALAGLTNSTVSFSPARLDMTADYEVVVLSASGSVTSQLAILVVTNHPPILTCQPLSQTAEAGATCGFSVCVSSLSPVSYQWQHNGGILPGVTTNLLTLRNVWTNDAGDYWCVASNRDGTVLSAVATLTVVASLPVISLPPQSQSLLAGQNLLLSVSAWGAPSPVYQWRQDGQDIPGATLTNFSRTSVTGADAGDYVVVLSNVLGVVTSAVATVSVLANPPGILQQPLDASVSVGATAHWSVQATGYQPLRYDWQRGDRNVPDSFASANIPGGGVNSPDLYLYSVALGQAGDYRVVIQNIFGAVTSAVVRLTVVGQPPAITGQPQDQTVDWGGTATFSASVSGTAPFTFQWQHGAQDLPGAIGLSFSLSAVTTNDAGGYRLIAHNAAGSATSAVATLTVLVRAPIITQQPQSSTVDAGYPAWFEVVATGAEPLSYQWLFAGEAVADATNAYVEIDTTATNVAGAYQVVVSNFVGSVTSLVATLTLQVYPAQVVGSPVSQTVDAGDTAFFSGSAFGSLPFLCQWQHNGQDIAGATQYIPEGPPTNNSYLPTWISLNSVSSNDAGSYQFVVSNLFGMATSAPATLTVVYRPPVFLASPVDMWAHVGSYAWFDCSAVGGPSPAIQWFHNGEPIPGGTGEELVFLVSSTNQVGGYSVVASNALGSVTSAVVHLTVLMTAPFFLAQPANQRVLVGDTATLSAIAFGGPPPSCQWLSNGVPIPGATNTVIHANMNDSFGEEAQATVTFRGVTTNDTAGYSLVAWNDAGSVTSSVASLVVLPPGPLDHWHWRNPLPQGNDLSCVASGNGVLVALGQAGARVVSHDDGATWVSHHAGQVETTGLAYGNGLFVAVGSEWVPALDSALPRIQTSTDGVLWTNQSPESRQGELIEDVAFGSGCFVAVTSTGAARRSTNGLDWTRVENAVPFGLVKVAFGNGLFVAAARDDFYGILLTAVSADGLTWSNPDHGSSSYPTPIAFGSGNFVVTIDDNYPPYGLAYGLVSKYGVNWAPSSMATGSIQALCFGGGRFVAAAHDLSVTSTSTDGTHWTTHATGLANADGDGPFRVDGLGYGGGHFVAVGDKGGVATSTNGETWTIRSPGNPTNLRGIAQGNNVRVAVGNEGLVFTSPDSLTWTRQPAPTTSNLRSIAFGQGCFVAVTEDGAALTSTTGAVWTAPVATSAGSLYNVTWGRGLFVAVGESGVIVTSLDGRTWAPQYSYTTRRLNAVACNGNLFIAVGKKGTLVTSTNAIQWTLQATPTANYLQGIACGLGVFVAAGESGIVLVSTNATGWASPPGADLVFGSTGVEDVQFANGTFIAVGASGFAATSTDGVSWTQRHTSCQNDLRCSMYADGVVTAVGNNETVLQSEFFGPALLRVRPGRPGEGFEFSISGEAGSSCRLQTSDDLVHWEDVFTFSNTRTTTLFLDDEVEFNSRRFYRVASP